MAQYNYWGYRETQWGENSRRDVRFIAFCNKSTFLRTIDPYYKGNWVKDRMSKTSNDEEINLINHHPNKMLVVDDRTNEILEVRNLVTKP